MNGKVNVLGVQMDTIRLPELIEHICLAVRNGTPLLITNIHVQALNLAYETPWLLEFFNRADIAYCDGMGVLLGARLLGRHIPERFTLADWIWELLERLESQGSSIYFLGNQPGLAQQSAEQIRQRLPELKIAGAQHGFFDFSSGSQENEAVLSQINQASPDVLLVGMGVPRQEKWLEENQDRLIATVTITCGGLFEYIAENRSRGPRWMTQHYLEWLFRLVSEPRRYWKRYLIGNPQFIVRILFQRFNEWKKRPREST